MDRERAIDLLEDIQTGGGTAFEVTPELADAAKFAIENLGGVTKMDVKEFFEKVKAICEHHSAEECPYCPLDEFCSDGIFAMNSEKAESVIDIVKNFDLEVVHEKDIRCVLW